MLLEHFNDEFGAGTVRGIVKFLSAPVCPEVRFILTAEEGALMMIEPPIQARIVGIFKIHYRVFVPVKLNVQKELAGMMSEPMIDKFAVFIDCIGIEIAENGRGSKTIEAIIMKIYLHHPHIFLDLCSFI
jgi:hypothetical protein